MIVNEGLDSLVLTVAIPTYNRVRLLEEALQSVLTQHVNGVEIVVLSNASADGTDEMMADYCARYDFIKYVTSDRNRGIDANIHRCSLEARGEYVYMMSDDDVLLPGALANLLQTILRYPDAGFIFLNMQSFEGAFSEQRFKEPIFDTGSEVVFHDKSLFAKKIHIFATLISCFVYKRALWNAVPDRERYIGTDIYLTYVLYDLLGLTSEMVLVTRPSVAVRAEYTGSYRIFYAFAEQWGRLLLKHAPQIGYDRSIMRRLFQRTIVFDLVERIYSIRTRTLNSPLTVKDIKRLILSTYRFALAWLILYPALIVPVSWHKKYVQLSKKIAEKLGVNLDVSS